MAAEVQKSHRIDNWRQTLMAEHDDVAFSQVIDPYHCCILRKPCGHENKLLVSFERVEPRWQPQEAPFSMCVETAEYHDWCHLAFYCSEPTWFRSPHVIDFFDQLIDEAFFDAFDDVLFYGAGACGYAAAAFSVASPGARILAISPQASLDYDVASWDPRFKPARKLDFTSRFGFAPDMVVGADQCSIIFDPSLRYDAMHAALFPSAICQKLMARHLPDGAASKLYRMGIIEDLFEAAMDGHLTPELFAKMYRARRHYLPYLSHLVRVALVSGHLRRAKVLREYMTPLIERKRTLEQRRQKAGTSEKV